MTTYLTLDRYKNLGGALDSTAFMLWERMAEKEIDSLSFNRIRLEYDGTQDYKEDLELLMFWLIENRQSIKEVSSESTDGVSISYKIATKEEIEKDRTLKIRTMLGGYSDNRGVSLFYRGVKSLC